jgi:hypothetical protein
MTEVNLFCIFSLRNEVWNNFGVGWGWIFFQQQEDIYFKKKLIKIMVGAHNSTPCRRSLLKKLELSAVP